ncbi:hypothetical protein C5S32_05470 [ANME-1 cluster archaeon GoMg1]|nr:hypothetical protein [ANME-1 cluster archaeon GoMg1]
MTDRTKYGLMDLEYAEDVEIDVCLNCNGAWLGYGELDKLKDKSEAGDIQETERQKRWKNGKM